MKLDVTQRKTYLLALMILIVAVALICVWRLYLAGSGTEETKPETAQKAETPETIETRTARITLPPTPAPETEETAGGVQGVVYYQDGNGYLVPVLCSMPYEDGIAKATLMRMVQSGENDLRAARLGLRTVLPENVKIDLDIADGAARIDLSKEALELPDAVSESNMVTAIVQTLTEFQTVKTVEFLFDGQKRETLPHGTDVSGTFTRGRINLEQADAPTSAMGHAEPVTLYFPGESASAVVPVTRMVYSTADLETAVLEMTKGPRSDALDEAVPEGCALIDVKVEDGIAKLNFTKEFMQIVHNADGGYLALKALAVTCTQFDGVDGVEIYVEGEKWDAGEETLAVPSFSNVESDLEAAAIRAQSEALFEDE